jgi:nucleoside-diphosphate-sugar epimerase
MRRTAFVTGANGFLGLNLIPQLFLQKWRIFALHLPGTDVTYLSKYDVTRVPGNLNDVDLLARSIPEGADAVFHLAGNTSAWAKNNAQQYLDNVEGTRNMVEASLLRHVRRFIYTSSISAYGYHPSRRIDERTVSNALSCGMQYHRTKFLAEGIIKDAVGRGLSAVILNPCNIVGPHDLNNWTRQFIRPICEGRLSAVPPGKAMWCHVRDVVDAHISAVDRGATGENYLLGGTEARFLDVVNEIQRQLGKKQTLRVQPAWLLKLLTGVLFLKSKLDGREPVLTPEKYSRAVADIGCDFRKAVAVLGYRTSPLSVMIADSLAWLKNENLLNAAGYVEVADEPLHREFHADSYLRAYRVDLSPGQTTLQHRHSEDTLYVTTKGGRMRTQSYKGYGRGPMVFPRSLPLRTKLWFAVQTLLTGAVRLPAGLSFFMPTGEHPFIHQAAASSRNRDSVCLLGIEILRRRLERPPRRADRAPWRTEYDDGSFFVRACALGAGDSCRMTVPGYHQFAICTKGRIDITEQVPEGKRAARRLAAGDSLCVDSDSDALAVNHGHASADFIVLAVPTAALAK